MVKKTGRFFFLFLLLISVELFSIEPSISISLETTDGESIKQACVGDSFIVKVKFNEITPNDPFPVIPGAEKFDIQNYNNSNQTVTVNGNTSKSMTSVYIATPKELGNSVFGSIVIENNGKRVISNKIRFKVGSELLTYDNLRRKDYFLTTSLNKSKVYLGEKLTLVLTFYAFGALPNLNVSKLSFDKFACSGEIKNESRGKEIINGREYSKISFSVDLFPEEVGDLLIPRVQMAFMAPSRINSIFDFFGASSSTAVLSPAKSVKVVELPQNKDFKDVSAVGQFDSMKFELQKNEANIGDGITAIISVCGDGNLEMIKYPKLSLPKCLKYYEASGNVKKIDDNRCEKVFEYVLQAEKGGEFKIPEQEFKYFDLNDKKYKKLKSGFVNLKIDGTAKPKISYIGSGEGYEASVFNFQDWQIDSIQSDFGSQGKNSFWFIEDGLHVLKTLLGWLAFLFFIFILILLIFPFSGAKYYSFLFQLYLISRQRNFNKIHNLFEAIDKYYSISLHEGGAERLFKAAGESKDFIISWNDFWRRFMSSSYASSSILAGNKELLFKESIFWAKKLLYFSDKIKIK